MGRAVQRPEHAADPWPEVEPRVGDQLNARVEPFTLVVSGSLPVPRDGVVVLLGHLVRGRYAALVAVDQTGCRVHPVPDLGGSRDRVVLDEAVEGLCADAPAQPLEVLDGLVQSDRILFAYASLLNLKDPTAAAPWFTALVYLNPPDNLGARFHAPEGRRGDGRLVVAAP